MAETSDTPHRRSIKVGAIEFVAEGSPEAIQEAWEEFATFYADQGLGAHAHPPGQNPSNPSPPPPAPGEQTRTPPPPAPPPNVDRHDGDDPPRASEVDPSILDRVYTRQKNLVSLRLLPSSGKDRDVDALVLLLYGYKALRNTDDVRSTELMRAAKLSGLQLQRLDRTLGKRKHLITEGGRGKGKVWGLNNVGAAAAEDLLRGIVK